MANVDTFLRWTLGMQPRYMRGEYSTRLLGTLALMTDMVADGHRMAVRARWLADDTPPSYLPHIGASRLLPRLPYESEARYRETLAVGPWFYHPRAGSPQSVLEHLERLDELYIPGTTTPITWDIDELPSGYAKEDFVYSIVLTNMPAALYNGSYEYGVDAPPYDGTWCYGTKVPAYIVAAIKEVCAEWGPKRSKLVALECTG